MTRLVHEPTDMMNVTRMRKSTRRLFNGGVDEIVGELLQNSQRAGATEVRITTDIIDEAGLITVVDNGHGLIDGVQGFWKLLALAESYFPDPKVADQDPMGLGVHALLAHECVSEVTFASDTLALTIDTTRWWSDSEEDVDYYTSWETRLVDITPIQGFSISIRCTPGFVGELRALTGDHSLRFGRRRWTVFEGYEGILAISCDGNTVNTRVPRSALPERVVCKSEYMGATLVIGYSGSFHNKSVIRWYGQLIESQSMNYWMYYLDVKEGRPINPMAPSRQGIIEDNALVALEQHVQDCIFAFLANPVNRSKLVPAFIEGAHRLDPMRALREIPYVIVYPYEGLNPMDRSYDGLVNRSEPVIKTYDEAARLLLLSGSIYVDARCAVYPQPYDDVRLGEDADPKLTEIDFWDCYEYGLNSFVPSLTARKLAPYHLTFGDKARLQVYDLFWRPGKARQDQFNESGQFGLGDMYNGTVPTMWHPVLDSQPVFAFNNTNSWNVRDVDWVAGTSMPAVEFLDPYGWYAWDVDEDESHDRQSERFGESIYEWIRELTPDSVPSEFQLYHLERLMPTPTARIKSVLYHYRRTPRTKAADANGEAESSGANRPPPQAAPIAITVRNTAGEKKRFILLG